MLEQFLGFESEYCERTRVNSIILKILCDNKIIWKLGKIIFERQKYSWWHNK